MITINSFGTELTKEDRFKLFPKCGKLYPDGMIALAKAEDYDQVRAVAEFYGVRILLTYFVAHSLTCSFTYLQSCLLTYLHAHLFITLELFLTYSLRCLYTHFGSRKPMAVLF